MSKIKKKRNCKGQGKKGTPNYYNLIKTHETLSLNIHVNKNNKSLTIIYKIIN